MKLNNKNVALRNRGNVTWHCIIALLRTGKQIHQNKRNYAGNPNLTRATINAPATQYKYRRQTDRLPGNNCATATSVCVESQTRIIHYPRRYFSNTTKVNVFGGKIIFGLLLACILILFRSR